MMRRVCLSIAAVMVVGALCATGVQAATCSGNPTDRFLRSSTGIGLGYGGVVPPFGEPGITTGTWGGLRTDTTRVRHTFWYGGDGTLHSGDQTYADLFTYYCCGFAEQDYFSGNWHVGPVSGMDATGCPPASGRTGFAVEIAVDEGNVNHKGMYTTGSATHQAGDLGWNYDRTTGATDPYTTGFNNVYAFDDIPPITVKQFVGVFGANTRYRLEWPATAAEIQYYDETGGAAAHDGGATWPFAGASYSTIETFRIHYVARPCVDGGSSPINCHCIAAGNPVGCTDAATHSPPTSSATGNYDGTATIITGPTAGAGVITADVDVPTLGANTNEYYFNLEFSYRDRGPFNFVGQNGPNRGGEPTPTSLKDFSAELDDQTVNVSWETSQEINVEYYNVFRRVGSGQFIKLNRTPIAPLGQGGQGARYTYEDFIGRNRRMVALVNSNNVTYRLQVVDGFQIKNYDMTVGQDPPAPPDPEPTPDPPRRGKRRR